MIEVRNQPNIYSWMHVPLVMYSLLTCLREWRGRRKQIIKLFFFLPFFVYCWCISNHGEACRVESGAAAIIIFLWQWRWVVDLLELLWQNEQRVREAQGTLGIL